MIKFWPFIQKLKTDKIELWNERTYILGMKVKQFIPFSFKKSIQITICILTKSLEKVYYFSDQIKWYMWRDHM